MWEVFQAFVLVCRHCRGMCWYAIITIYIYIPYISPYHYVYLTFPSPLFFLIADLQGVAKDSDCDLHFQLCSGREQSLASPHCVALFHVKADVLQCLGNSWQFPTSVCWLGEAASSKLTLCPDEERCIPYRIWLVPSPCPESAVLFHGTPVLPTELWPVQGWWGGWRAVWQLVGVMGQPMVPEPMSASQQLSSLKSRRVWVFLL